MTFNLFTDMHMHVHKQIKNANKQSKLSKKKSEIQIIESNVQTNL